MRVGVRARVGCRRSCSRVMGWDLLYGPDWKERLTQKANGDNCLYVGRCFEIWVLASILVSFVVVIGGWMTATSLVAHAEDMSQSWHVDVACKAPDLSYVPGWEETKMLILKPLHECGVEFDIETESSKNNKLAAVSLQYEPLYAILLVLLALSYASFTSGLKLVAYGTQLVRRMFVCCKEDVCGVASCLEGITPATQPHPAFVPRLGGYVIFHAALPLTLVWYAYHSLQHHEAVYNIPNSTATECAQIGYSSYEDIKKDARTGAVFTTMQAVVWFAVAVVHTLIQSKDDSDNKRKLWSICFRDAINGISTWLLFVLLSLVLILVPILSTIPHVLHERSCYIAEHEADADDMTTLMQGLIAVVILVSLSIAITDALNHYLFWTNNQKNACQRFFLFVFASGISFGPLLIAFLKSADGGSFKGKGVKSAEAAAIRYVYPIIPMVFLGAFLFFIAYPWRLREWWMKGVSPEQVDPDTNENDVLGPKEEGSLFTFLKGNFFPNSTGGSAASLNGNTIEGKRLIIGKVANAPPVWRLEAVA